MKDCVHVQTSSVTHSGVDPVWEDCFVLQFELVERSVSELIQK